ncbi:MAG TPA: hypothetical protein VKE93_02695 [Candidatus Angelobacter sp.]|nr:hypothetical protein [Candidatus Angelobacter sp.]
MSINLLTLRKLKYRHLPQLIGRQITIPAITHVEEPILAAIVPVIRSSFKLKDSFENLALVMRKYGFLDVTLICSEQLLAPSDRISRGVIRDLGYSPSPDDDWERAFLEVLVEDIAEQACFLRLFLNSKWSEGAIVRFVNQMNEERSRGVPEEDTIDAAASTLAEKMHGWFPVTFTVEDVCLSNSGTIWLAKHGYL